MFYIKKLFPQWLKNIYHLAQAMVANVWFGFPSRKIKIIGVTGTDGKTTTVQMITAILEEAGKKVATASTINFKINRKEEKNLSHFTTSSAFAVQKFIAKAISSKCEYLVLETSSHALDQHRVWGIKFQTALITNVTREHLDYHKTIKQYREAKGKLFEIVKKNNGKAIVNLDMENPEEFLMLTDDNCYGYTIKKNQESRFSKYELRIIQAEGIELKITGSKFQVQNSSIELNIPGLFNIENALAAACVGLSESINLEVISRALRGIKSVPGRMETVKNEKGLNVIVDFALTPNALDKLYAHLFSVKKDENKIIAVFGSCGERDRGKRPIMGEIVSKYADLIILTNDEPYRENPENIIEEIAAGISNKKENETFWKIPDRRQAIRRALQLASAGDIIVVTGMGNFETMIIGCEKIPWSDKGVIQEELKNLP